MIVEVRSSLTCGLFLSAQVWDPSVDKTRFLDGAGRMDGSDAVTSASAVEELLPSIENASVLQTTARPGPLPTGTDIELQNTASPKTPLNQAAPSDGTYLTAQDADLENGRAASDAPKEVSVMQPALDLLSKRETASSLAGVSEAVDLHRESSDNAETCAICLADYEEGVLLRPLPCKHAFHTGEGAQSCLLQSILVPRIFFCARLTCCAIGMVASLVPLRLSYVAHCFLVSKTSKSSACSPDNMRISLPTLVQTA